MKQQRFLCVNANLPITYPNFDRVSFRDNRSFYDYDAVIIDTEKMSSQYINSSEWQGKKVFAENIANKIKIDYERLKGQCIELLNQGKNLYVLVGEDEPCYMRTGETKVENTGTQKKTINLVNEFNMFSFLPIQIEPVFLTGKEFGKCDLFPYNKFFNEANGTYIYKAYFTIENSKCLLTIKNTTKMVSAVCNYSHGKIVFLPSPHKHSPQNIEERYKDSSKFINALINLDLQLSNTHSNDEELPLWANEFYILSEETHVNKLVEYQKNIDKLNKKVSYEKEKIQQIIKYKTLLTSSGEQLENIVKLLLIELGFSITESETGRSDVVAKFESFDVVCEIKGLTKSSSEKNVAQLEKWANIFLEKNERTAKPILIVNAFCNTPVFERIEVAFPHQMLSYASMRNHCLITTSQLLCLFIDITNNPHSKSEKVNELLTTVGVYAKYPDIKEFLKPRMQS